MPKNYYLSQLYKHIDQPTLTFSFRGIINWMRSWAIVCEQGINAERIKELKRRKENELLDWKR
jgi:hypothetical protein